MPVIYKNFNMTIIKIAHFEPNMGLTRGGFVDEQTHSKGVKSAVIGNILQRASECPPQSGSGFGCR